MVRIAAALAAMTAVAGAQPVDRAGEARAAADAGAARFRAGDFRGAVERFRAAYELVRDPSHLFNIAQAFRHAGDCVHSAEFYKRFLDEVPDPPNAAKIRGWYESEERCARARRAPDPAPPPPRPEAIDVSNGSHARTAIVVGATGAVAFSVAGGFAWRARRLGQQVERELADCTLGAPCSADLINDLDARGGRANTIAVASLVVGVAAVATAVTLWVRSPRDRKRIAIAPREGGAWVVGSFRW